MSVSELTVATHDYLKAIWSLQEWTDKPVTLTALSRRVAVAKSTASDAIKKLAEAGLVAHNPYGAIELTNEGTKNALAMVRRHRILELYLVEELGYQWDQVDAEAEKLEHAVSDFLIEKMDEKLGHPTRDPHGDPIPSSTGKINKPDALPLCEAKTGSYRVERISDFDPGLLRYLDSNGIDVLSSFELLETNPYSGSFDLLFKDGRKVELSEKAANYLWVSKIN
ncbi:metal-dependent transcriptional regulator [Propionimicrobium lymphophilum]|uniref:metal-dependent transcriptional regulator n=1 Tax=Propionimicrobium lymphophilum TaxID=33012 RepID=UPI0028894F6C|nr:metal-dependent transcriptional regulator [Propionimicrobium lymphophilum]